MNANPLRRHRQKKLAATILKQILFIALSLVILMPVYMVIVNSFKGKAESARMSLSLPTTWHFENYSYVIKQGRLIQGFGNSMLYAVGSTVMGVLLCAMAAFVISRNRTKFNKFVYYFAVCGLFVPINYVTLIRVLQAMGQFNTRTGIILVFTSAMIPFCIFTLFSFVGTVPVELDEAAVLDGAGPFTLFFRVVAPLMKPALVTCFILQFMGVWSDFLTPLYLSNSSGMHPMNLAVYQFVGKNKSYWNYVFADIVLTCLPVVIVYLIGQKQIIGGLTTGAVKD